ncbi:MAG: DUF3667 domain-containing protein [Chitinophagaceae bacterium]
MQQVNSAEICQTCGAGRTSKFCPNCGEKKPSPEDMRLKKYLLQGLDAFTHFEGKFFKSFKYLLFQPGKLTADYVAGRRVKLMKPLQLYVIVGIAFFFLFKSWDIFFVRLQYAILGNYDAETGTTIAFKPGELKGLSLALRNYAEAKASAKGISLLEFVVKVDGHQPALAKLLAFLMIPLMSLFIYATAFKQEKRYVPHLVHATHLFTFLLAIVTVWLCVYQLLEKWLHWNFDANIAFLPPNLLFIVYAFLSFRKVLPLRSVLLQILRTLVLIAGLIVIIPLYREIILWISVMVE